MKAIDRRGKRVGLGSWGSRPAPTLLAVAASSLAAATASSLAVVTWAVAASAASAASAAPVASTSFAVGLASQLVVQPPHFVHLPLLTYLNYYFFIISRSLYYKFLHYRNKISQQSFYLKQTKNPLLSTK